MIWLWIGIVMIFYIVMLSTARYDNFQIVGIPIDPKLLESKSVQAALNQYKIKTTLFSFVFISLMLFTTFDFFQGWHDTLLILILIAMILTNYIVFIQLQDTLSQIKLHYALQNSHTGLTSKQRVDLTTTREKGKAAPRQLWAWIIWLGSLTPFFFNGQESVTRIMLWVIPFIFLLIPLVYPNSITFKTRAITNNPEVNQAYQARYEWIKGMGFLIMEASSILGYILITLPVMLGWSTMWMFGGIGIIFISVLFVMAWNSWQISQLNEKFLGKAEWLVNETQATYRWGVYHNPADSRIFVPKITGLGTTVNAAHPIGRWIMIVTIALLGVLLFFVLIMMINTYTASLQSDHIMLDATIYQDVAYFEEIDEISLSEENLNGIRVHGYGGMEYSYGSFRVDNYGPVRLYMNNNNPLYIVIEMEEGIEPHYIIFNEDTVEATEVFYQDLMNAINE